MQRPFNMVLLLPIKVYPRRSTVSLPIDLNMWVNLVYGLCVGQAQVQGETPNHHENQVLGPRIQLHGSRYASYPDNTLHMYCICISFITFLAPLPILTADLQIDGSNRAILLA